ncbi:hypothetical protein D3C81_1553100 [compost metagenome]
MDMGEIHARLFKNPTVTQHPAASAATCFALPAIFNKFSAVYGRKLLANIILQAEQELFNALGIGLHD